MPDPSLSRSGARTWTSDLAVGDTVQTADGMLHRVEGVELMVTIKPLGDTAALPLSLPADNVKEWPDA